MIASVVESSRTISALNPATGEKLGEYPVAVPGEVVSAVRAMREAQPSWEALGAEERAQRLLRLKALVTERADEIALTITKNTGKPLVESYSSEVVPIIYLLDYFAKHGPAMLSPESIPLPLMKLQGRSSSIVYKAVGVVAVISPWNYPFSIPMGDVALALLAGCGVVLKPSELVPAVGELIQKLCRDAELPVRVVIGDGGTGAALIEARPDKIIFTGGSPTGRKIMEAASKRLIPVVLELGGKDPMIVCSDANIEVAARAAVWGCFTNSGQVCASVKRVYVMNDVADLFIAKVIEKTKALRIGDPMSPETDIGAMISAGQREKVERQVQEGVREGAKLVAGGRRRDDAGGFFFEPAVFVDVKQEMKVAREEIFGPVLPILRVRSEEEAIRLANDSPFGLTASVFSRSRGPEIASKLRTGTVTVNDSTYTHACCETPWGGVGESGFGRAHGKFGLLEFVTPLHINVNPKPDNPSPWWFPYDKDALEINRATVRFLGLSGVWKRAGAFLDMVRNGLLKKGKKVRE